MNILLTLIVAHHKKNYAGTVVYTKIKPLSVENGIGVEEHAPEGRCMTLEFKDFYLLNTYVPNSGLKLDRLVYRSKWDDAMLLHIQKLEKVKPVIWTGDLNVAHNENDLAIPDKRKK